MDKIVEINKLYRKIPHGIWKSFGTKIGIVGYGMVFSVTEPGDTSSPELSINSDTWKKQMEIVNYVITVLNANPMLIHEIEDLNNEQ